jgi:tRNA threonylcarbamoyl adenosine modification protein YeaZ
MRILAVDTALGACSAALLDEERVLAHELVVMERGHAEALAPMVQALMQSANLRFDQLDRLAVTTGPGTFTGQRVGLAFMRGLRLALKRPLIGVTTLQAMAAAAMDEANARFGATLHDAKRSEAYVGLYSRKETLLEPALLPIDDAIARIRAVMGGTREAVAFSGTAGEAACADCVERGGNGILTAIRHPDALWVARLALRAPESGDAPHPLYLRPPDARLPAQSAP